MLISNLHKSETLLCLHLCGNIELSTEFLSWITKTVDAQKDIEDVNQIHAFSSAKKQIDSINKRMRKRKLRSLYTEEESLYLEEEQKWRQIRHGLKLKAINQSKRMHKAQIGGRTVKHAGASLVMTRHMGLDHLIPEASKWKLLLNDQDECWLCEQHIITLYIWTPRIGLFQMIKNESEVNYYQEKLKEINGPMQRHSVPHFASAASNWEYKPM